MIIFEFHFTACLVVGQCRHFSFDKGAAEIETIASFGSGMRGAVGHCYWVVKPCYFIPDLD